MVVGVISDIHSNLTALEAVLADLPAVDELWCLGDIVGYGPHPNECIEVLRARNPTVVVAGNHDWAAIERLDASAFNLEAAQAIEWTARQLTPRSKLYLESLPSREETGQWTIVHGSPRYPIWEYLLDCAIALPNFKHFSTTHCLVGHTHVPAVFVDKNGGTDRESCESQLAVAGVALNINGSRAFVNPGSIGQPRDGDPRASYLLLDTDKATLEYRRVPYDIGRTQDQMKRAGLPSRLWRRLSFGL